MYLHVCMYLFIYLSIYQEVDGSIYKYTYSKKYRLIAIRMNWKQLLQFESTRKTIAS